MLETKPSQCDTVFYDGACPLCRREIALYKSLKADKEIAWTDISAPDYVAPNGLTLSALKRRLHIITNTGKVESGAAAFVHIWANLPGWKVLAHAANLPGALPIMELTYRGFLKVRPAMQWAARGVLGS